MDRFEDLTNEPLEVEAHRAEVERKFGDGQPYNRDRIEGEIRTYARQYSESVFEAGKRLILLKEHEGHGNFLKCLERLGIDRMTANNMMAVVKKLFRENPKCKTVLHLPVTKMYVLSRLNDEDLEEFAENGEIEGLSKEDAEKMTSVEFKKRIRELNAEKRRMEEESRQVLETKDALLAEKNKKIDVLDGKIRAYSDPGRWDERAREYMVSLMGIVPRFSADISKFTEIVSAIEDMKVGDWSLSQIVLVEQAKHTINAISENFETLNRKLWTMCPEGNAVFHSLSGLRVALDKEKEMAGDV